MNLKYWLFVICLIIATIFHFITVYYVFELALLFEKNSDLASFFILELSLICLLIIYGLLWFLEDYNLKRCGKNE